MTPYTDSCHWFPWSEKLEKQFTFESTYDGEVQCFTTNNEGQIGIPRGVDLTKDYIDGRDCGIAVNFKSSFKPQKAEQERVIQESVTLLKQHIQFIVQAPTGWGKTYVGTEIAGQLGTRFCVITTKEDSLHDWVKAIKTTLNLTDDEVGIWRGDQTPKPHHKAVVSLVHSVCKGPERYGAEAYKGFGLILCDEVHRMAADGFSQAMWHFPAIHRLGLSATPYRKDGKDKVFFWHIGQVLVSATMEVLIPKVLFQQTGWKVPNLREWESHEIGDISGILPAISLNPPRNELLVKYIKAAFDKGRSSICFSDNLKHLDVVADLLVGSGVLETDIGFYVGLPSDHYGGSKKAQMALREQHTKRPILLSTYKMGSEATNLPWLDTVVMMTPKADVTQAVGRIRREYEDKKEPLVVDFVDEESFVLRAYAQKRLNWYKSLGARVVGYSP